MTNVRPKSPNVAPLNVRTALYMVKLG